MILHSRHFVLSVLRILSLVFATVMVCGAADFSEWKQSLVRTLAEGHQAQAESMAKTKFEELVGEIKALPKNSPAIEPLKEEFSQVAFWNGVFCRSRFSVSDAIALFCVVIDTAPNSLEAKLAANIIGVDLAKNKQTAFYFFNALIALAEENPKSVPTHWLIAILSRSITGKSHPYYSSISQPELFHIQNCGVRHYEKLLREFSPGPGPVLVHQTLANLLSGLRCKELALAHRETALAMERAPWVLHGMGQEHLEMGNYNEALRFFQEAIDKDKDSPPAYYYKDLGLAFWNLKRYQEALQAWDKAAQIDPDSSHFWRSYTNTCRLIGDYPRGWNFVKKFLEKFPNSAEAKVVEAQFAAFCNDPEATSKQKKAGSFDFQGHVVKDDNKKTDPWYAAIAYGDTQAFLSMVEQRDINAPITTNYSQTPLMIAAQRGWMPILRELIRRGAALDIVDSNKDTALHYASNFNSPEAVAALVEAGADLNLKDKWSQTPLIMCLSSYNREGARIVLANGADPTLSTGQGGAAINYAAGYGEVEMLKKMLQKGASPSAATGGKKRTPLIAASGEFYHQSILPPLLEAGADINTGDKHGNTALHYATNPLLNRPLVYFLLDNGADPNKPNAAGIDSITQARLLGYEDIAALMEKSAGAPNPFSFPKIEAAQTDDTSDQAAALLVTPILLAQGNPAGTVITEKNQDKKNARNELSQMFGIFNKKQFADTVEQFLEFRPQIKDVSLQFPGGGDKEKAQQILTRYAQESYGDKEAVSNDNAWVLAHVIYLADLGAAAEMLTPEEADELIKEMLEKTKKTFGSWKQFYESFLLGAKHLCGWEHERYTNICRRLEQRTLPWIQ